MCLPLISCFALSGCLGRNEAPLDLAPPPPEIVALEIPERFLADVPPRPMARGSSIADVAAYIAEFEAIVATANDQFDAARLVQQCHRALIAGEVERCE